jgi:site-specific DNA recombinase
LVSEALFDAVHAQLDDNRRRARTGQRGAKYLLQGLLVCRCCGYALYGKPLSASARKNHPRTYAYYRCIGSDGYRFGGQRLCDNPQLRTDRLEQAVWAEVCRLLDNPHRLAEEYQHRLAAVQALPGETEVNQINQQIAKLRQGIVRLIDGYAEGYLDKAEAEPRIRRFKERLQALEEHARQLQAHAQQQSELQLVIGRLEAFSEKVKTGLDDLDWLGRRELIRTLVKRVEIDQERVNVVFRVEEEMFPSGGNDSFSQHCRRGPGSALLHHRVSEHRHFQAGV